MEQLQNIEPEIWGGIECTINRVNDQYFDQLGLQDYYSNDFIDQVISLNVKKLRFPVLWEKHQPLKDSLPCFKWAATQINKLNRAGIEPIVGLVHHGSGPSFTQLDDNSFPGLLAAYATQVAKAFPQVKYYCPVNEPLTTARFSGLYGLWYPHKKSGPAFLKILLLQLKAIVVSMQAIWQVNPAAVLVQTEDLAKTHSTPLLGYQAFFENERRWLTFDILCGRFNRQHMLWQYFIDNEIPEEDLLFFQENPCPPGIMGVNYYITSERFLDEDLDSYPPATHGGNNVHRYADVEAVRVPGAGMAGPEKLIRTAWERFNIPIAITEVHLHCSREEQLRWFKFMHDAAKRLVQLQVNIKGITAWALLGSSGWSSLLTGKNFEYETGAFDLSAGYPRLTALGYFIRNYKEEKKICEPLLLPGGWWQASIEKDRRKKGIQKDLRRNPLLILGKTGTLGNAFAAACRQRNIAFLLLDKKELDVCSEDLQELLKMYKPWALINATGYVNIDMAEEDPRSCELVNSVGVMNLALACNRHNIRLLSFSSDMVFDGLKRTPYLETDEPRPLNVYGSSKLLAEKFMEAICPSALTVRTSAFFGPQDDYNFLTTSLSALLCNECIAAAADQVVSPTYVPHLVQACLNLLIDREYGIWHLANKGEISWYEFARKAAVHYNIEPELVKKRQPGYGEAVRPSYAALSSNKYALMPTLEQGMEAYFRSKVTQTINQY